MLSTLWRLHNSTKSKTKTIAMIFYTFKKDLNQLNLNYQAVNQAYKYNHKKKKKNRKEGNFKKEKYKKM